MSEHKNTILAIVLSLLVVIGWQYFIGYPQMEKQREQAQLKQQEQTQTQPGASQPNAAQPSATPGERSRGGSSGDAELEAESGSTRRNGAKCRYGRPPIAKNRDMQGRAGMHVSHERENLSA